MMQFPKEESKGELFSTCRYKYLRCLLPKTLYFLLSTHSLLMNNLQSFLFVSKTGHRSRNGDRGWDGWKVSPTQWTWVWANSGSWWWTGKPGVLQSIGLQRVRQDWVTEQQQWSFWSGSTTSSESRIDIGLVVDFWQPTTIMLVTLILGCLWHLIHICVYLMNKTHSIALWERAEKQSTKPGSFSKVGVDR